MSTQAFLDPGEPFEASLLKSIDSGAHFSADRSHRFLLWRKTGVESHDFVLFVGLNPSIADEKRLDPTVTRCFNYAKKWGFGYLLMGNLYSRVSTDPKCVNFYVLDKDDIENNWWELSMARNLAKTTVVAWGSNADPSIANKWLRAQSGVLYCLGQNANGSPKHPLYLRSDVMPRIFTGFQK